MRNAVYCMPAPRTCLTPCTWNIPPRSRSLCIRRQLHSNVQPAYHPVSQPNMFHVLRIHRNKCTNLVPTYSIVTPTLQHVQHNASVVILSSLRIISAHSRVVSNHLVVSRLEIWSRRIKRPTPLHIRWAHNRTITYPIIFVKPPSLDSLAPVHHARNFGQLRFRQVARKFQRPAINHRRPFAELHASITAAKLFSRSHRNTPVLIAFATY